MKARITLIMDNDEIMSDRPTEEKLLKETWETFAWLIRNFTYSRSCELSVESVEILDFDHISDGHHKLRSV